MADPSAPRSPFAPWDRRELPGLFTVEESARRVGHYAWIEMRLFEALGGWVATVPELDVKTTLGRHCYHHAWHAELWHKRLPELREMRPERLIQAPNAALEAFVAALTEPEGRDLTIEKLVGVYRVLAPRKIAAYTYHLAATSQITDAPTIRSSASSSTTRRPTGGRGRCSSSLSSRPTRRSPGRPGGRRSWRCSSPGQAASPGPVASGTTRHRSRHRPRRQWGPHHEEELPGRRSRP
ncbi:MAG TPA: hypothetical protein VKO35_09880 [Acidimicrobiia bacterium]|nr:hypothetical protein [Acidimicrobiia bacterium]